MNVFGGWLEGCLLAKLHHVSLHWYVDRRIHLVLPWEQCTFKNIHLWKRQLSFTCSIRSSHTYHWILYMWNFWCRPVHFLLLFTIIFQHSVVLHLQDSYTVQIPWRKVQCANAGTQFQMERRRLCMCLQSSRYLRIFTWIAVYMALNLSAVT